MSKRSRLLMLSLLLISIFISGCLNSKDSPSNIAGQCSDGSSISGDEFLILAPKTLFSGGESAVTMAAFNEGQPVVRCVDYTLTDTNNKVIPLVQASTSEAGNAVASFEVPEMEEGQYTLTAKPAGSDTEFTATVQVVRNNPIFIETDKPIYKPGQTIHGRLLTVNNNLLPVEQETTVDITDAKGVKVFKENLTSNEYGVTYFDLPLASELNLGTWKIKATSGSSISEVDIRVEKYVLPKFDVQVTTPKEWFLVSEPVKGSVSAEYFFGKQVEGNVTVEAMRYVGTWEQYAIFTSALKNGSVDLELPEVGYAAGTYGAEGQGSFMLNVTVTDTGGHSEKSTQLLTVAQSPVVLKLIPESNSIKPGMPLQVLLVTQDPGGKPVDTDVSVTASFTDENYYQQMQQDTIRTKNGTYLLTYGVPAKTQALSLSADTQGVYASVNLNAIYSPSASFIHISQTSEGVPKVGGTITFKVYSTNPGTVFYDVFANGRTVYSATSDGSDISIPVTPQMSPTAKVVAYMINPNNEVSVDVLPFDVQFETQVDLSSDFSEAEVKPGDNVSVNFDAGSQAMIGVSIVDESVYALSEGRLNLQQVFSELEKRFMEPLAEAHPTYYWYQEGAYNVLDNAGMVVMASPELNVPKVEVPQEEMVMDGFGGKDIGMAVQEEAAVEPTVPNPTASPGSVGPEQPLAEVQRVRQFFPETWVWIPDLLTNSDGKADLDLNAPDSITTWRLHAVSSGPQGIGISESQLKVFQDFFIDPDLPYAVIRGEQFPIQVQVYNYLDREQQVFLTLKGEDWFQLVGSDKQQVTVAPNSVNAVSFTIRPAQVGTHVFEITGQTTEKADAVKKDMIVEPEGATREVVDNGILGNASVVLDAGLPFDMVKDSGKILVSFTPSIVAQTISGVDDLLGMPYGCGEQNMMLFSTDVEVLRYLKATGQENPQIRAKAETYIITGYQRELTYRHADGSFSAFGESDGEGSLWLTDFVLSQFSGARDITTIDEDVLKEAAEWIGSHQHADGSWESVGFVIHQDMMGGVDGAYALTAYTTLALEEYGSANPEVMAKAQQYLEANLAAQDDPYALAIGTLALQKLDSSKADEALDKLLAMAKQDEDGTYWGYDEVPVSRPYGYDTYGIIMPSGKNVETTAYATLALIEAKDPTASSSLKWIAAQRNAQGGFSSTQDTVMAFRALMTAAASAGRDIDATVSVTADNASLSEVKITPQNFDVVQIVEVPVDTKQVTLGIEGEGEVSYQLVKRFNVILPDVAEQKEIELNVTYDATNVAVDDIVTADVRVKYNGMPGIGGMVNSSGMMIVDIAVPTGFTPVTTSLDALRDNGTITRYEIAGRKVVLYIDEMQVGEELNFTMQMKALFPVKAAAQESKAYSYYNPGVSAEVKGVEMNVT
ncbi:alpha-2-macroglobulin family protein [uncultured Methanomethylovorans sp.]|uniref:alpha-2-macroglobulin family protein n=1 Tax=uncultured Methanomethylovorans sp. TaxID=183759 RepID=UPI0026365462|nr:alpha-2-macroglobulin family protein [uncultured Methanomethylovorans sp.]